VLDYGCGSGILGIAAAKLGRRAVLGVDIDDNAVIAARDNAANNKVALELRHSKEQTLDESFDIVVANILTNPLCVLAPLLAGRVAPGGRIALAGVLAPRRIRSSPPTRRLASARRRRTRRLGAPGGSQRC
jgi:ribosomal protein L11 methyltransferase